MVIGSFLMNSSNRLLQAITGSKGLLQAQTGSNRLLAVVFDNWRNTLK